MKLEPGTPEGESQIKRDKRETVSPKLAPGTPNGESQIKRDRRETVSPNQGQGTGNGVNSNGEKMQYFHYTDNGF